MSGSRILWGQVAIVLLVGVIAVWAATEWTAWRLGFQSELGAPWFMFAGWPIYYPPAFFWWWYFYDAYAPSIFVEGATIAASGGFMSGAVAIGLTAGFRSRHGRVLLFDPTNGASSAYNPLLEVRRGDKEVRDVQNIADILVDPEGALDRRNHWEKTSHSLLVGAILHVLYAMSRDSSLRNLSPVARRRPRVCRKPSNRSMPFALADAWALSGSGGVTVSQKRINSDRVSPTIAMSSSIPSIWRLILSMRRANTASSRSEASADRKEATAASITADLETLRRSASASTFFKRSGSK